MSTQVMIFLVALMICLTIVIRWVLDYILDKERQKSDRSVEYWRGRYYSLANVLDKGMKHECSEALLEEIDNIKL